MSYQPRVHIRDEQFLSRSLCGQPWRGARSAGRPCSDSDPPYVTNDESGSVSQTTCLKCIELYRAKMLAPR
jgi:hypothetical protein